jgi:type II secretory pathway pseudopilin PulG
MTLSEIVDMKNMTKKHKTRSGFTLIEALFAAMLLGLVIAALAAASGSFTMDNGYGVDLSTAEFLIEEVRERTANIDVDTLLASYDGQTFSPPVDVSGADMADFDQFSQQVEIDYVESGDFARGHEK